MNVIAVSLREFEILYNIHHFISVRDSPLALVLNLVGKVQSILEKNNLYKNTIENKTFISSHVTR